MPRLNLRKNYTICPTCKGKGYFDGEAGSGVELGAGSQPPPWEPPSNPESLAGESKRVVLPKIRSPQLARTPSKIYNRVINNGGQERGLTVLPDRLAADGDRSERTIRRPLSGSPRSLVKSSGLFGSDLSMNNEINDFINEKKQIDNIKEFVHQAKIRLRSSNWETLLSGAEDLARALLVDGAAVDCEVVAVVLRRLSEAFAHKKSKTVRRVCHVLRELFKVITVIPRPSFDGIVNELIKKTGDTSRSLRCDADKALDSMVSHVPVQYAIRAILAQAPGHKNAIIRHTAMRLVENIISMMSPEVIFTHNALKEARRQILNSLCSLIDDPNQDVRWTVRRTLQVLIKHERFEEILNADVDSSIIKKADRALVIIQYEKDQNA